MTIFSNTEERVAEKRWLSGELTFFGGDALAAAGGKYEANVEDFQSRVVIDRELITGQNPQSDHDLATAFIAALDAQSSRHRAG